MADAAILNLFPVAIFDHCRLFSSLLNTTKIQNFMNLNPQLTHIICFKFKMAPVRHVGFSIISVHYASLYKICCKNFDRHLNYGPETKFKMAAAAILNLLPVAIFNILPTLHYRCQPLYKISCIYLTPRLNYNNFLKFKMATVRHLGFSKTWFLSTRSLGLPIFHLGTKFGEKMLIDAEIMAENRNPRLRPSAILDLLHHHIGPPTKSFHWAGPYRPVKFYTNPMHSFEDMTIWFFCRFGLKCLFTPRKFWFWGSEP